MSYPDSASTMDGGGFAALFVLVLLGGLAVTVWKVSTARRMARNSGMSESDATAMTLLTDDGLEATYLAANLRPQPAAPGPAPEAAPEDPPETPATPPLDRATASERLRELRELLDQGLITQEEHDRTRQAILDSL